MIKTKTDPDVIAESVQDEPMQLREWGTERIHALPSPRGSEWTIGSAADAWLHLQDREQFVSRRHAVLRYRDDRWMIEDAGSKNGLWIDGERTESMPLIPGSELGIGRLRLIVESPRVVAQRALLGRLLGWHPEKRIVVDRALRMLREFTAARIVLWITGEDDLIAVSRRIHREVAGDECPFVLGDLDLGAKAMEHALRSARGGTLCIWSRKTPSDMLAIRKLTDRQLTCRVIVCASTTTSVLSIDIPALATRTGEVARVIDEYATDAVARLGARPSSYTSGDREMLLENPPATLADVELTTLRMVAIREYGGVTHAAPHLGITHSALSRWLARRVMGRR